MLFSGANLVPVGRDQLPHLQLTRHIARRCNPRYSPGAPLFLEPAARFWVIRRCMHLLVSIAR